MNEARENSAGVGPIVSAAHLADGKVPALSELEFGMIMAFHAFQRWMVRCMAAAGQPGLGPLDVLVLHAVNHRGRAKTLADLCLVLNVEDTHLVSYSLRKLEREGLIRSGRKGKEKTATITEKGAALCRRYRDIREELLVKTVRELGLSDEALHRMAEQLRILSGHYGQAARAAASL
jgi:predicted MarR family transcription regulator